MPQSNDYSKKKKIDPAASDWTPSQKDIDWRYMTKEQFLKKYPEEKPEWYHPPPSEEKFLW